MVQVFACNTWRERSTDFSALFVRYIATRYGGLTPHQVVIQRSEHGKPYIAGADDLHFNISHAGTWCVCAIHTHPVGIDIEEIVPIDTALYREHLSTAEYYQLSALRPHKQHSQFFELWALKEIYMKQTGLGIQLPPWSFTIQHIKNRYVVLLPNGTPCKDIFFHQYDLDPGYKMSVCATADQWGQLIAIKETDVMRGR